MPAPADVGAAEYPWERPLGARPRDDGTTEFRVWAPRAEALSLRVAGRDIPLEHAGYGVYEAVAPARPGDDYWYSVSGQTLPDPCSRSQPEGIRGPSRIVEPAGPGPRIEIPRMRELVIYELHIGTFSAQGTFDAAIEHLSGLAELGVNAIEVMPVAEFPGHHGWGYDGIYISAAHSAYGGPEGFGRLIEAAHEAGLAVILDVVYNHVGPSGTRALEAFGPYFTDKYETPWGKALNYDDSECDPVREWVLQSAVAWVRDFGIDGLRLDAIHAIVDSSAEHLVPAVARRVY
jgi:maltooligosyltrehalose trehalohydrolase